MTKDLRYIARILYKSFIPNNPVHCIAQTEEPLLFWGSERIEQERERAEQERERAEQAERRAEGEKARADRLAAQLKAMGIDLEAE